jgi:hypothetical protein
MSEREEAIEKLWNSWHELLEIGERFGFARMHETGSKAPSPARC